MASSHCAVCSKLIFTFERKVKITELNSDELTGCASVNPDADFPRLFICSEAVLCVPCYRRVQAKTESGLDESANQSEGVTDSACGQDNTKGDDPDHTLCPDLGTSTDPPCYPKKDQTLRKSCKNDANPSKLLNEKSTKTRKRTKSSKPPSTEASSVIPVSEAEPEQQKEGSNAAGRIAAFAVPAAVLGGLTAVVAAPVTLAAVGFGAGGVVAGSVAASMMSSAWTTGVGVGVVSLLQSIGMTGLGVAGAAAVGTAGGAVGAGVGTLVAKLSSDNDKADDGTDGKTNSTGDNPHRNGDRDGKPVEKNHSDTKNSKEGRGAKPDNQNKGSPGDGDKNDKRSATKDGGKDDGNSMAGEKTDSRSKSGGKSKVSGNRDGKGSGGGSGSLQNIDAGDQQGSRNNSEKAAENTLSQQEIMVAAASAISSGPSLAGTTTHSLMQDGYWVTCGIEVENWTRFHLIQPHVQLKGGALSVAPSIIVPAAREVMVARKTSGTATGSCGTVSWLIQGVKRRLVIMWSAPFNFNHHSNWLGLGLSAPGVTEHAPEDEWFDRMYYTAGAGEDLKFKRREYYSDVHPLVFRDTDFEVEGIMASDHKALIKVTFRPISKDSLAPNIKEKMLTK